MFNRLTIRICLFFFLFLPFCPKTIAQPVLPDLASVTQNGINILTWVCQYEGVKSVAVLRSNDSNFNYSTIGYVKDVKKGVQFYIDGHPKPGNNWYKVNIVFGSNLSWTSNRIKITLDSAEVAKAKVLPSNDSLQVLASKFRTKIVAAASDPDTAGPAAGASGSAKQKAVVINTTASPVPVVQKDSAGNLPKAVLKPAPTLEIPDIEQVNAYTYIKSQYIFTNPFTGHVNVEVADFKTAKYSIDFFDNADVKVLEVPRINEPSIVIDKRNFQRTGMYKFELSKDKVKIETGYITIY